MSPRDIALAVAVATVWGVNFVVIEVGLEGEPPLLLSALRFGLAGLAVFVLGPPRVPIRYVVAVGIILCVGKFSLLFVGMDRGMPAGLSSLVLQSQVVFTVLFAVLLLGERPRPVQLVGIAIACFASTERASVVRGGNNTASRTQLPHTPAWKMQLSRSTNTRQV